MLNFTSALYLGLRHPAESLRPWTQLTTGVPYALDVPLRVCSIQNELARMQGLQSTLLGPSTFHLFWDVFGILKDQQYTIYLDAGAYPISKWGVERATASGIPLRIFSHRDADRLAKQIKRDAELRRRPVIVSDGFCPACGNAAPLPQYVELVVKFGGYLIIDDTQALGIFGHDAGNCRPYGSGGGGSLQWYGLEHPRIISISSMAKGFGVPIAALSGSCKFVRQFESNSETRIHTSPPSIAAIHAAEHALMVNRKKGDMIRQRLAYRVLHFRRLMKDAGLVSRGGFFPVQSLPFPKQTAERTHKRLGQHGVLTLLQQSCGRGKSCISFVITARHSVDEIVRAIQLLIDASGDLRFTAGRRFCSIIG